MDDHGAHPITPILGQAFYFMFRFLLLPFVLSIWLAKWLGAFLPNQFPNAKKPVLIIIQVGLTTFCFILMFFALAIMGGASTTELCNQFSTLILAAVVLAAVGIVFSGANLFRQKTIASPLGQQKFADEKDMKKAGLLPQVPSLVLGLVRNQIVAPAVEADWHAILVGGQGTGKTSNGIIPTLLSFQGSAIVFEIKGELYDTTAGYRSTLGPVYKINPCDPDSWVYDPISACDDSPVGINECSLADLARMLTTHSLEQIADIIQANGDEIPIMLSNSFLVSDSKVRGYYASSASDYIRLFNLDFEIRRCTTAIPGRTWTPDMLETTSTVYLQIPEIKLKQSADLWRLIFMQLLRHLQGRGERKTPYILVCLDEFPQLGKMDMLPEMLATLRSRNIHVLLAGQSIADIDEKYQPVTRRMVKK